MADFTPPKADVSASSIKSLVPGHKLASSAQAADSAISRLTGIMLILAARLFIIWDECPQGKEGPGLSGQGFGEGSCRKGSTLGYSVTLDVQNIFN